jgi:hypothetical protein
LDQPCQYPAAFALPTGDIGEVDVYIEW